MKAEERCNYRIINLAYACPLCIDNPHCPLKEIRAKSFNDKIAWFNSLSSSTKWTIHNYHFHCYFKHIQKKKDVCPIARPKKTYDIKKGDDVAESGSLPTTSGKNSSWSKGSQKKLCKIKEYMFGSILCGETCSQGKCRHQYVIGGKTFCSSPSRKEIYQKYHF